MVCASKSGLEHVFEGEEFPILTPIEWWGQELDNYLPPGGA